MTQKEYIEALENSLIFMCQCHEELESEILNKLMERRDDDLWMQWPRIQGSINLLSIAKISKLEYNRIPKFGFKDIYERLQEKAEA